MSETGVPDSPDDRRHATSWAGTAEAELYERGRPGYPQEARQILGRELGLGPGRRVADVGAGTGKLTRLLTGWGAQVVAVEPMAGMREQLRCLEGAETVGALAELIPILSGTLDAVTVAQAFHWFRLPDASRELRRVLRPDGRLAIVFNRRDDSYGFVAALSRIMRRYEQLAPRPESTRSWRENLDAAGDFGPPAVFDVRSDQRFESLEEFDARFASVSFAILLPVEARTAMLAELRREVAAIEPLLIPMRTVIEVRQAL